MTKIIGVSILCLFIFHSCTPKKPRNSAQLPEFETISFEVIFGSLPPEEVNGYAFITQPDSLVFQQINGFGKAVYVYRTALPLATYQRIKAMASKLDESLFQTPSEAPDGGAYAIINYVSGLDTVYTMSGHRYQGETLDQLDSTLFSLLPEKAKRW